MLIDLSTPESEESNEDEEQDIEEDETGVDENEEPPIPPSDTLLIKLTHQVTVGRPRSSLHEH